MLYGDSVDNILYGNDGDDDLYGGEGDDGLKLHPLLKTDVSRSNHIAVKIWNFDYR